VQVIEVLGRNTGWIAAATALARHGTDDAPHLIYVPERRLPLPRFLDDVNRVFSRLRRCVVVVCEGQLDAHGEPFGADVRLSSRGPLATNLGHRLAALVTEALGLKARAEKPGLLGRVSAALRSDVDWHTARLCGAAALRAALDGATGEMVTIVRRSSRPYASETGLVALDRVADVQRFFPVAWINEDGTEVSPEFMDYLAPLVGTIEENPALGATEVAPYVPRT
jgi:6-phosphofructokinase 1